MQRGQRGKLWSWVCGGRLLRCSALVYGEEVGDCIIHEDSWVTFVRAFARPKRRDKVFFACNT